MTYNLTSIKEIIGSIAFTYNVKSANYINKVPQWIGEGLGELKLAVSLQPFVTKVEVSNYRGLIPSTIKRIDAVLYDGKILPRVHGKRLIEPNQTLFDPLYVRETIQEIDYNEDGSIRTISTSEANTLSISTYELDSQNNYLLKPGYIDTSFESGIIHIYGLKLPTEVDEETGAIFPLIPDKQITKNALTWLCLRNILYSGYNHPTLSLHSNNMYINPAMMWEYLMPKARNENMRLDREQRELHMKLWTSVIIDADDFLNSFHVKKSE